MKRTIALLSAVLLISAVATAGVTNPEGFEGYALTTDWQPTLAVEGWELNKMYGVEGGQLASIVDDGGDQILDINSQGGYGMTGTPMWAGGGGSDASAAVTSSGFDIKPLSASMGSEFHARIGRYDITEPSDHATWEVGVRVSHWSDFQTPHSPYDWEGGWNSTGTYVYLRTWVGPGEVYTETEIPGFGLGSFIVAGMATGEFGDIIEVTPEWYSMEIEEDNVLNKTRARMYLRGGTPNAWTPWMDHAASSDYSINGDVAGFLGGQMQFDNFYITPEPATMVLLGAGSLLLLKRKRKS